MYTYNYHNSKHVHLQLSQYKTCTPTIITIQNMYTYNYHSTYMYTYNYHSTYMYTYNYHHTKHVLLQLSQYKTCRRTTLAIEKMYT